VAEPGFTFVPTSPCPSKMPIEFSCEKEERHITNKPMQSKHFRDFIFFFIMNVYFLSWKKNYDMPAIPNSF
jgi:hypothetical protein